MSEIKNMKAGLINMKIIKGLSVLLLSGIAMASQADNCNCPESKTDVEKIMHAEPELASRDYGMRNLYEDYLTKATDKEKLKKEQAEWLKERDACETQECLIHSYIKRESEIGQTPVSVKLVLEQGRNLKLCKEYKAMLDERIEKKQALCGYRVMGKWHEFSSVKWQDVSIEEYMREYIKVKRNSYKGTGRIVDQGKDTIHLFDTVQVPYLQDRLVKGYVYPKKTSLDTNYDGINEDVYMNFSGPDNDCERSRGGSFIKDKEYSVATGPAIVHGGLYPFFYGNKVYYQEAAGSATSIYFGVETVCSIREVNL